VTEGAREQQGRGVGGASPRAASWLAWSTCALSVGMAVLGVLFLVLLSRFPHGIIVDQWLENVMVMVVFSPLLAMVTVLSFSTMGAVIASRRPDNIIGWLFCAIGFVGGVRLLSTEYAAYSLVAQPDLSMGGEALAWIASWLWVPDVGIYLLLALMFPDGRLPSARWRPLAWLIGAVVLIGTVAVALSPGPIRGLDPIDNPLGMERLPNVAVLTEALLYALGVVAVGSVLVRLRRSRGVERQQIKWFAYAGVVLAASTVITYVLSEASSLQWLGWVAFVPGMVGNAGMPVAVGVAILRYRLYEIDLIINRTLVYGPLTATLVALYFGAVVLLQRLFVALTGQQSTLAVVASTLLIAALFTPLRGRIQSFIDRRFYRRKYDARKTLEAFSAKLRDETDLDALSDDLTSVVRETMQPAHVSLWLRPELPPRASEGREQVS
jgi:hypothetical protein